MFDVGDLVVCVDAHSPPKYVSQRALPYSAAAQAFLVNGRYYRVTDTDLTGEHVRLQGDPYPAGITGGFRAVRFRKINAPDTEVSRLIRACKPVREGQPA